MRCVCLYPYGRSLFAGLHCGMADAVVPNEPAAAWCKCRMRPPGVLPSQAVHQKAGTSAALGPQVASMTACMLRGDVQLSRLHCTPFACAAPCSAWLHAVDDCRQRGMGSCWHGPFPRLAHASCSARRTRLLTSTPMALLVTFQTMPVLPWYHLKGMPCVSRGNQQPGA